MRNLKFLGVSFLLAMTAATSGVAQKSYYPNKIYRRSGSDGI
ncbi:hypothetical protein NXW94_22305 [Bacteroides ovatus]|nr:hypothetical protein [Bacteroides ovatus]